MKINAKERIVDILLVTANMAGLGVILFSLNKAAHISTDTWLMFNGIGGF